jgi:hypothetical protein
VPQTVEEGRKLIEKFYWDFISSYNVTDSSKVAAVVQVLILQSKVIPDKSSEHFKWCKD